MGKNNLTALGGVALGLALLPLILRNPYYIGVMVFVGIYSLITIGLSLLMGYAGQISLGHAAFFAMGAYASGLLATRAGLTPCAALIAAALLTSCVAFVVGVPVLKLRGHYLAMATLGLGEIMYVVLNAAVDLTGGPSGFGEIPRIRVAGLMISSQISRYYLVWGIVLAALALSLNIIHSRVGRALRSIHGSEVAANAMGVDTSKYKIQVFVLSAAYASIAGSLYAHFITFVSPSSFGLKFSILLVTMVVVGGMSNVWGALLGTAVLGTLPEALRSFKDYDILIYGSILLLMVMFAPEGLFGLMKRAVGRWS